MTALFERAVQTPVRLDGKLAQIDALLTQRRVELRDWVVLAIRRALGQLASQGPSRDALTPESVMARMQRRAEYLDSPAYQRETERRAGQTPGVRVWGSDSTAGQIVTPGHIMATNQQPGGLHSSFGGSPLDKRAEDRQRFAAAGGEPIAQLGWSQPPMQLPDGSRMPPQPVSQMPGRQFTLGNDPYAQKFADEQQLRPGRTFSHEFHPDFLPPKAFDHAVEPSRQRQENIDAGHATLEDCRANTYQVMSVAAADMPPDKLAQARAAGFMKTTMGHLRWREHEMLTAASRAD